MATPPTVSTSTSAATVSTNSGSNNGDSAGQPIGLRVFIANGPRGS